MQEASLGLIKKSGILLALGMSRNIYISVDNGNKWKSFKLKAEFCGYGDNYMCILSDVNVYKIYL